MIPPNYPNLNIFTRFQSPDRGFGLKSVLYISHGTPILSEQAYFSVADGRNLSLAQENDPSFQALSCPAPITAEDRFNANNFETGNNRCSIFLTASGFNHSCRPNVYFAWNWRSRRLTVNAIVDIPTDTEIFVNYHAGDYLKNVKNRRRELRQTYGFECDCEACQADTAFGTASRERRKKMRYLDQNIDQNQSPNLPQQNRDQPQRRNQTLADIKAFSFLLQLEGLFYPQLADVYGKEISWYIIEMQLAADRAESARYQSERPVESLRRDALQAARLKLDLDVACNGHNSPEVVKTLNLISDLDEE